MEATERSVLSKKVVDQGNSGLPGFEARVGENPTGCPIQIKVPVFSNREERTSARDRDLIDLFHTLSDTGLSFHQAIKVCMAKFYLSASTCERIVLYGYKRKTQ